jgi:hypothetical protein
MLVAALGAAPGPAAADPSVVPFGERGDSPAADVGIGVGGVILTYFVALPLAILATWGAAGPSAGRGDRAASLLAFPVFGAAMAGQTCLIGRISDGGAGSCPAVFAVDLGLPMVGLLLGLNGTHGPVVAPLSLVATPAAGIVTYNLTTASPAPSVIVPAEARTFGRAYLFPVLGFRF